MLNIFFKKSNNFTCTEIILTFNTGESDSLLNTVKDQCGFVGNGLLIQRLV